MCMYSLDINTSFDVMCLLGTFCKKMSRSLTEQYASNYDYGKMMKKALYGYTNMYANYETNDVKPTDYKI